MAAARRLFVERGFHNVSMPDIVRASGVSTGAIYSHFGSKENLIRQIHERTITEFQALFFNRISGRTTTFDKLSAFAELVFETTENDPAMMEYMLFLKHGEILPDVLPICFTAPFQLIKDAVNEGMASGALRRGDTLIVGLSYTGVILRAVELRLSGILSTPLTEIETELIYNAWSAIKA